MKLKLSEEHKVYSFFFFSVSKIKILSCLLVINKQLVIVKLL